jgi:hypothetical protein
VGAIESLEDRGGGLPGQEGVGVDCSCATHWWCLLVMLVIW